MSDAECLVCGARPARQKKPQVFITATIGECLKYPERFYDPDIQRDFRTGRAARHIDWAKHWASAVMRHI